MLIVYFSCNDYAPQGLTIDEHCYAQMLRHIFDSGYHKWPQNWEYNE
jgi:hypothetical protein